MLTSGLPVVCVPNIRPILPTNSTVLVANFGYLPGFYTWYRLLLFTVVRFTTGTAGKLRWREINVECI